MALVIDTNENSFFSKCPWSMAEAKCGGKQSSSTLKKIKPARALLIVTERSCAFNQCLVKVIRNLWEKANQWKLYVISCYSTCLSETLPSSHLQEMGKCKRKKKLKMKIAILFLFLNNCKVKFAELKIQSLYSAQQHGTATPKMFTGVGT